MAPLLGRLVAKPQPPGGLAQGAAGDAGVQDQLGVPVGDHTGVDGGRQHGGGRQLHAGCRGSRIGVVAGVEAPRPLVGGGAAESTGGQCQQPAGDEPRVFGWVVAGDGLVERIHHDGEGLLAIERRRVAGDAAPQTGQQAGGHDTERAWIGMGGADERAEELILAVLATRAQHTAQVAGT